MTVGCCRICLLMVNTLFSHDQRSSALLNNFTRMLKASPLWWDDSALSYPTSRAAVTPAHASYPRHSSSAVVFGAAETCRNIRDLWSFRCLEKGLPRPRSRPEGVRANLPTSRTHVVGDRGPACICRSRPSDNSSNRQACQLCPWLRPRWHICPNAIVHTTRHHG